MTGSFTGVLSRQDTSTKTAARDRCSRAITTCRLPRLAAAAIPAPPASEPVKWERLNPRREKRVKALYTVGSEVPFGRGRRRTSRRVAAACGGPGDQYRRPDRGGAAAAPIGGKPETRGPDASAAALAAAAGGLKNAEATRDGQGSGDEGPRAVLPKDVLPVDVSCGAAADSISNWA